MRSLDGDHLAGAAKDWSAVWAASGAAGLSGRSDGPALDVPVGVVRLADRFADSIREVSRRRGRPVDLDGPALLGERAAISGLARAGDASCGGATRLLRAADGWIALSLARDSDVAAVPAWLETATPPGGDGTPLWAAIAPLVAARPARELIERAVLLGMPVGGLAELAESERPTDDAVAMCQRLPGEPPAKRFADFVVADLSSLWAGPLCAHVLGAAGARVIKIESTRRPDGARRGPPAFFDVLHGGHESVCLDFGDAADRTVLRRLLERADIVIESSRPRALEQLQLGRETITGPRLWVSITAHGRTGRAAERIGFGDDASVAGGLVASDPSGPCFCADAVADPLTGLAAASAALEALDRGGRWHIDVALSRTAALAATDALTDIAHLDLAAPRARTVDQPGPSLGQHTDSVAAELV